ncbi:MAG TPA: transketolase [Oligoflexia bacterium]|nr:transketolase [Oligoflexia bacterium]HMP49569.1 transketolase [Oligoflexia bacterium]
MAYSISTSPLTDERAELLIKASNTIRFLSADGVEKAKSGHPGMPMGMAELASVLWLRYLKHLPSKSDWIARDRFVLSNGHGSMLLYSMLHLSGYKLTLDDLKQFRQWESKTPGHPESYMTDGVETTTGPLGQGIGNAVGIALAQKLMSARYGDNTFNPVDHRVWCFCGDGCLMEGVSSEASSVAGHLGLDNLIIVYDDNNISIAGRTDLAFTEDVEKRYQAYGFHTLRVDGHDVRAIDKVYSEALSLTGKPVLILAKTIIGKGSPNKCDSYGVHGAPLGKDELELSKKGLDWPAQPMFFVPDEVRSLFASRAEELSKEYENWNEKYLTWLKTDSKRAETFEAQLQRKLPTDLEKTLVNSLPEGDAQVATRKLSETVLQAASNAVPSLIGGSADLEPSTLTLIKGSSDVLKGSFEGKNIRFGVREHGMGAIMNGLSYYGGFIPYGSTFFCFLDYMKPTLRLAALCHLQGLFIYTHDSIFLGEDGPTHQPIEHLQMTRSMPNVLTLRPADGLETAICYAIALEKKDGPSAIILTRQNLPQLPGEQGERIKGIRRGAYTVYENDAGTPDLVFVATGSEVSLALDVAKEITGKKVRVVSMPCYELFKAESEQYRKSIIPDNSKKVTIEAAITHGWRDMVDGNSRDTLVIGMESYGASAPAEILAEKFGFTKDSVLKRVREFAGL